MNLSAHYRALLAQSQTLTKALNSVPVGDRNPAWWEAKGSAIGLTNQLTDALLEADGLADGMRAIDAARQTA